MNSVGIEILLWLFVIDLGIVCGAGLYEHRIILPQWFSGSEETGPRVDSEAMRKMDVGRSFWVFVTTIPLTILALASLVVAYNPARPIFLSHAGALRFWWLTATGFALLDRIATFSFFIPRASMLMRAETLLPSRSAAMASLWVRMNWVRLAFVMCAWLAALKAFSLLHATSYSLRIDFPLNR